MLNLTQAFPKCFMDLEYNYNYLPITTCAIEMCFPSFFSPLVFWHVFYFASWVAKIPDFDHTYTYMYAI